MGRVLAGPRVAGLDFLEALDYIDRHTNLGVKPGLDRMRFLCELMGDPQHAAPAVHITGTNGKGSTARMVSAVLGAGGLSTGTFMSPHLQSITERISLDSRPISEVDFAAQLEELLPYFEHMERATGEGPTYFEITTVMALAAFAGRGVDVAVVEVGLGGRWDATNVVDGQVAVVTNVDIDHVGFLGDDRGGIATEKAGIVKPGSVAICGETDPEVVEILQRRATEVGATLWRRGEDFDLVESSVAHGGQVVDVRTRFGTYRDLFLPLHGRHQAHNAACAVAALEAFHGGALAGDLVQEGLAAVRNPGRLEVVGRDPLVVLDVAHNPHGAAALAAALPEAFHYRDRVVVIGILGEKDRSGMLPHLVKEAVVVATAADWHTAVPPEVLAKEAEAAGATRAEAVHGVPLAVDRARELAGSEDLVLITGSHYSVGEARTHLVGPGAAE